MTEAEQIAQGLSADERRYVFATPSQMYGDPGIIAHRAGDTRGGMKFAGFARRNSRLFQRSMNCYGSAWNYRLSPLGSEVLWALEKLDAPITGE